MQLNRLVLLPISSITYEFDGLKITLKRFPSSWSQRLWALILWLFMPM